MVSPGERVVVAVSGGPDSVCLLHLLKRLSAEENLHLFVAHLNHMLREEALNEEEFVRKMAEAMSLPFYSERIEVKAKLRRGETLEEGARRIRYDFLLRACEKFSAFKVALGHNADDLVETVIFNLIRGTGLRGIRGIPPIRCENSIAFIRPLINIWRQEIEGYLQENKIPYVIDRSNLTLQFTRNKIRHQVIPLLMEINPRAKEAIHRFAQLASEAHDFINEQAIVAKEELVEHKTRYLMWINLPRLSSFHPVVQKEALRLILSDFLGDISDVGSQELEVILKIGEGEMLTLPKAVQVEHRGEKLVLRKRKIHPVPFELPIKVPGYTFIPPAGIGIEVRLVQGNFIIKDPRCLEVTLDMEKIRGNIIARNWRRGDRMVPLGMKEPKKLQDIFVDSKVPREERYRVPILCDEEGIIWVVGLRISERVKVDYQTKLVLHLRAVHHKEVIEE